MPPAARKGFTLVELLVVISIIAILAIIGLTIFSGVQKGARDAKRKGDINAIVKAMEINYGKFTPGVYSGLCQISSSPVTYDCKQWFANDLPQDPINNWSPTNPQWYAYCYSYGGDCTQGQNPALVGPIGAPPADFFIKFCARLEGGGSYCLTTSQ